MRDMMLDLKGGFVKDAKTDAQVVHLRQKITDVIMEAGGTVDKVSVTALTRYLIENGAWEVPVTFQCDQPIPGIKKDFEAVRVAQVWIDKMLAKRKEMLGE